MIIAYFITVIALVIGCIGIYANIFVGTVIILLGLIYYKLAKLVELLEESDIYKK